MIDEQQPSVTMTELERNALARQERLNKLRAQMAASQNTDGGEGSEAREGGDGPLVFRSYRTLDTEAFKKDEAESPFAVVKKQIGEQLDGTHDTVIKDTLDLNTLAPRKVDWDLRRAVQDKLDVLDRKTQKAIAQLIRQRLEADSNKDGGLLASAVNSAAAAAEQDDAEQGDDQ